MTGSDLIVAAPWIAFAVALAIVCILLLRSDRASRRGPGRPFPPSSDLADPMPRRRRRRTDHKDNRPDPQEARCPEEDPEARLR